MLGLYFMKCLYCQKELKNPKARFCNAKERMRFKREGTRPGKTLTIITETLTKNPNKPPITLTEVKTLTGGEKILKFTKSQPISERIKKYWEMYPDSTFVPNWVAHGFLSKEEALENAIHQVNKNDEVMGLGLNV